jgi:hypothetical protein
MKSMIAFKSRRERSIKGFQTNGTRRGLHVRQRGLHDDENLKI